MVSLGRLLAVLVMLLAFAPQAESTESIVIDSGFFSAVVTDDFGYRFSLNGAGFSITESLNLIDSYDATPVDFLSHLGLPTDLSGKAGFFGPLCGVGNSGCTVQLHGATFSGPVTGLFTFSSVIPSTQPGFNSAPFSFTGSLFGQTNLLLTGSGTATALFIGPGFPPPDTLEMDAVRFDFAPIPEPATVLLLAVGLVGLVARHLIGKAL